jgi:hypothetical protein
MAPKHAGAAPPQPAFDEARLPSLDDYESDDPLFGTSYDVEFDAHDRLVPVKYREDGWTPRRQRLFLETLADTGSVTAAARAAGMTVQSAYRLRRRADAAAFDAAWEGALERAMQQLMPVAIDRAMNGTPRQRFYKGELVGEDHVPSDRLLIWLLERGAAMLGYARERALLRAEWDGALDAIEEGAAALPDPAPGYTVARLTDDHLATNAPPPPDYDGNACGKPGDADYLRFLTPDEAALWDRHRHATSPAQEATRRRFFGLDRAPRADRAAEALAGPAPAPSEPSRDPNLP